MNVSLIERDGGDSEVRHVKWNADLNTGVRPRRNRLGFGSQLVLDRKSEFSAMAEHQSAFKAKFCGKDVRIMVGSVAVQIFNLKHKLLRTIQITSIPQWSNGWTEAVGSTPIAYWVHIFVGEAAPHWVERRIELQSWTPPTQSECQRLDFFMTPGDCKLFTGTLNDIATQIAVARQKNGRDQTVYIASKLTCEEVQTPRSAQCLVNKVASEAKDRLGNYRCKRLHFHVSCNCAVLASSELGSKGCAGLAGEKMNGDQKLTMIKAHAERESTVQRFAPEQAIRSIKVERESARVALECLDRESAKHQQMDAELRGVWSAIEQESGGRYWAGAVTDDVECI